MKKLISCLMTVIATIVTAFWIAGCNGAATVDPNAYSYITLDINPSVEIITLGDRVIDVKAANYDACVLLDGEDFSSMTLEDATTAIVALAEKLGYLTDENNQVKISVISDSASTIEILKNIAKSGAQKGSQKAVPCDEVRLQDELTVRNLKSADPDKFAALTEEKVRLIESVMELDASLTYDKGAAMTVNELSSALRTCIDEYKDIFTAELRSEFSAYCAAAKQDIKREIAAIFGEDYLAAWEKYTALEDAYNSIVSVLDRSGLSDEDVQAVTELLGISDVALIRKDGVVKPDYVIDYIEKHMNKKSAGADQASIDAVIDILETYDISKHVLTQAEIDCLSAALGEEKEYETLSQVSTELAVRKSALDDIEQSTNLTSSQIEQIRTLKEGFTSIRERALEAMADSIATVRAQVSAERQARESGNDR